MSSGGGTWRPGWRERGSKWPATQQQHRRTLCAPHTCCCECSRSSWTPSLSASTSPASTAAQYRQRQRHRAASPPLTVIHPGIAPTAPLATETHLARLPHLGSLCMPGQPTPPARAETLRYFEPLLLTASCFLRAMPLARCPPLRLGRPALRGVYGEGQQLPRRGAATATAAAALTTAAIAVAESRAGVRSRHAKLTGD